MQPSGGAFSGVPAPGQLLANEVAELNQAFAQNPKDLGIGLYHPGTGEMHLASFDQAATSIWQRYFTSPL